MSMAIIVGISRVHPTVGAGLGTDHATLPCRRPRRHPRSGTVHRIAGIGQQLLRRVEHTKQRRMRQPVQRLTAHRPRIDQVTIP